MTSPCEGNNSIKFLKNVTYFLHSENDFFFFLFCIDYDIQCFYKFSIYDHGIRSVITDSS